MKDIITYINKSTQNIDIETAKKILKDFFSDCFDKKYVVRWIDSSLKDSDTGHYKFIIDQERYSGLLKTDKNWSNMRSTYETHSKFNKVFEKIKSNITKCGFYVKTRPDNRLHYDVYRTLITDDKTGLLDLKYQDGDLNPSDQIINSCRITFSFKRTIWGPGPMLGKPTNDWGKDGLPSTDYLYVYEIYTSGAFAKLLDDICR